MNYKRIFIIILLNCLPLNFLCFAALSDVVIGESPVKSQHLEMIKSLFSDYKINDGNVNLDNIGRVTLTGSYKDSTEVSLAFSLAQSVVGVKWVSPVTPENIKVKDWEKKLSSLFPSRKTERLHVQDEKVQNSVPTKYALIVGISEFKNNERYKLKTGKELNLRYAEKDAREMYEYIVDPQFGNFNKNNVFLLINEDATKLNIQNTIDQIKKKAGYNDDVFVYFSSHGTPNKYDGSMDIVTYDTDLKSINTSWQTSFSTEYLRTFIHETRANNLLIVLDVCYSGAAFRNIDGFYYAGSKSIDFDNDNQGISKSVMAKSLMGAKDIVFEDDVVTVSGDDPNNKSTKVLISASDAGEKSWESDSLRSSFFTNYFLKGLKRSSDIKQAFEYAKPQVTESVMKEKEAEQHPQVVSDKKEWNIVLSKH
jgi:hypothetical protein